MDALASWYPRGCGTNLAVVEDLAEAHGIRPHEDTDAAAWSFFKNKIVAGEEGGAVWFRDPKHARLARQLRCLGFTDDHDFTHVPRGHNYRMSNLHAAPILRQLERWGQPLVVAEGMTRVQTAFTLAEWRREIEGWHDAACPDGWRMPPRDAVWVYDLRIRGMASAQQDKVVRELQAAGIAARHGFKPLSGQEEYMLDDWSKTGPTCPNSLAASREVIYLPVQPGITTPASVRLAFDTIHRVLGAP